MCDGRLLEYHQWSGSQPREKEHIGKPQRAAIPGLWLVRIVQGTSDSGMQGDGRKRQPDPVLAGSGMDRRQ